MTRSLTPQTGVHWLSGYHPAHPSEISSANLASFRLRAGALASISDEQWLTFGEDIPTSTGLAVIGKLGANDAERRGAHWLSEMKALKNRGGQLILDYTDDHLSVTSPMTRFYQQAIGMVDLAVCSSPLLAQRLAEHFSGQIEIVPDAIEVPIVPPKTIHQSPVTVLWFGHASNLTYLLDFLPRLSSSDPIRLIILCNVEGLRLLQSHQSLPVPRNVRAEGIVWSIPQMLSAAAQSDLCIIPSNPTDRRKAGVSSNRLLTALALGLPTAADRVDSYLPYSEYFTDIRSPQLQTLLKEPLRFSGAVAAAQAGPILDHALPIIGQKWRQLVSRVMQKLC